jgi:hypothetical protein
MVLPMTADWRLDRDGPVSFNAEPFFPGDAEITPAWANSVNKATKWQQLSSASQDYSQSGTDIPTFSEGSGGAYSAGSDQAPRGFNYQYQSPSNVAADPSFDIMGPDIDSPTVDRWIKESTRPRLPIPTPEQLQQRVRQFKKSLLRPV